MTDNDPTPRTDGGGMSWEGSGAAVRSDAEAQAMLEQVVIRGTDGAVVVRDGACTACGAPVGFVRSDGTGQVAVYHEAGCPYGGGWPLGASRLYDAPVEGQEQP